MNELKMDLQHSIRALTQQGWSQRKIARELGVDRETVARHRRSFDGVQASNPAIPPTGSASETGSETSVPVPANPAILPAGRRSRCEELRAQIIAKLELGLSAQRIYQDLVSEHQFSGGYDSVKRFVAKLAAKSPLPFRRMECLPGEEAQVDYGQGAWIVEAGRRRRPHILRVILSFSRKGYTEAFWAQTTENFVRGLENSFRHFGGVPNRLVIDNLRAAVNKADWFDPVLNPKIISFCEHYGCIVLPTKPAMPRHKGKVEAGVKYAQSNGLAGRVFSSLAEQNLHLADWEANTADTRIHGTVCEQVRQRFVQQEQRALRALPPSLFPVFQEAPRQVHRDGHVEVAKAFYSVPPEYVARSVWARWDSSFVRISNERREQIAIHSVHQPGRFSTLPAHIHAHKRAIVERGADYLLDRCRQLGPGVQLWAQAMYQNRGVEGMRVLQGLLHLADTHSPKDLNTACRQAVEQTCWRLREIKTLLEQPTDQTTMPFLQEHPLIRPLSAYQALVPDCFAAEDAADNPNLQY